MTHHDRETGSFRIAELPVGPGRLGITVFPGAWGDDLDREMARIRDWDTDYLVTVIKNEERVYAQDLGRAVVANGIQACHAIYVIIRRPIAIMSMLDLPRMDALCVLGHLPWRGSISWKESPEAYMALEIQDCLRHGGRVLVHGRGRPERIGVMAAWILKDHGASTGDAVRRVCEVLPGAFKAKSLGNYRPRVRNMAQWTEAWHPHEAVSAYQAVYTDGPVYGGTEVRMAFEKRRNRCRGAMVGLAVGNLLGLPCRGQDRDRIRCRWPDGIREIEAEPGLPDDDDLAQTVILAEACHAADALDVDDLARRFWTWGDENGFGMDHATYGTLTRYGGSPPRRCYPVGRLRGLKTKASNVWAREPSGLPALEASRAAWEASGRNAAGSDVSVRCAPLAIRWRCDDAALVRNTVVSAAVTHWDSHCIWSAVFVNLAIASLLSKLRTDWPSLVERVERARTELGSALAPFGVDASVPAAVTEALDAADVTAPADLGLDGWDTGCPLGAMQVALWCARRAADFKEALIAVINAGGDTDTNGAVAGAVLGARFGLGAVPERWRDRVAELRAGREAMEVWADRLMR